MGAPNTLEHRVFIEKDNKVVSPFHDIPLFADEAKTILNMIVEVPRWTNAKMEICKEEPFNPILQDTKKGKLRFVRNCFPHHGYIWNYGAFPQTWEDPNSQHAETGANGDNDPLAPRLNDIEDVERHLPGLIRATNEWFRIYKIPDGKPENVFAFSGEAKSKKYAVEIIHECHEAWRKLVTGEIPAKTEKYDLAIHNTQVKGSKGLVSTSDQVYTSLPADSRKPAAPIDPSISKSFFISSASA